MGKDTVEKESGEASKEKKEDLESKVKTMEEKIRELEKSLEKKNELDYREESLVGDLVGSLIPGFAKIVKTLEKASPEFRQRIAETDSEIKHRLDSGWSDKNPSIRYGLSIRPLDITPTKTSTRGVPQKIKEVKVESTEIEPIFDIFEEDNHISVIAEIPDVSEEEVQIKIAGNELNISAGLYSKVIVLPSEAEEITERSFKNGVLQLKMKKRKTAD